MTLLRNALTALIQVLLFLGLTILVCFFVGWCLGWVVVGFRAVAG